MHIDVEQPPPTRLVDLLRRRVELDARVIDKDIDTSQRPAHGGDRRATLGGVRHVHTQTNVTISRQGGGGLARLPFIQV